jgi:hypothetical protein
MADAVKSIRVHNNSGLVFRFMVATPGNNPGYSRYIAAGDSTIVDLSGAGGNGTEICPTMQWDTTETAQTHSAGTNCLLDKNSAVYGVYDVTGTVFQPGFSYQGTSADPS